MSEVTPAEVLLKDDRHEPPEPHSAESAHAVAAETQELDSKILTTNDLKSAQRQTYQDLDRRLFTVAQGSPSPAARSLLHWLINNPGHTKQREYIMKMISSLQHDFIRALEKRLHDRESLTKEKRAELGALKQSIEESAEGALIRTIAVIGEAYKVHNTHVAAPLVTTGVASTEVMDTEEILDFKMILAFMRRIDMSEMIDIVIEDQVFVSMMLEQQNAAGQQLYRDYVTGAVQHEPSLQKLYHLEYANHANIALKSKLDITERRDAFGEMTNHHNYISLARLIAGNEHGKTDRNEYKKKSINRTVIEASLWVEIVRHMNPYQKEYLVYALKQEFNDAMVKSFLQAGMMSGVISQKDLKQMSRVEGLAWVGEEAMKAKAQEIEKVRTAYKKVKQIAQAEVEQGFVENAVMNFGLDGAVGAALTIAGGVTSFVNMVLPFSDVWNDQENKTVLAKIKKGVGKIMGNGFFWFGIGEIALGRHMISPFTYNDIIHIPEADREQIETSKKTTYFFSQLQTHPGLGAYLKQRWEEFDAIARMNAHNTNPKQAASVRSQAAKERGFASRGNYELYDGDFAIDSVKTTELGFMQRPGFPNPTREAEETIALMFHTARETFNIQTSADLQRLLNKYNQHFIADGENADPAFFDKQGIDPAAIRDLEDDRDSASRAVNQI